MERDGDLGMDVDDAPAVAQSALNVFLFQLADLMHHDVHHRPGVGEGVGWRRNRAASAAHGAGKDRSAALQEIPILAGSTSGS